MTSNEPLPVGETSPVLADRRSVFAGALLVAAALLTAVGTFLPLFTAQVGMGGDATFVVTMSGWSTEVTSAHIESGLPKAGTPNGYPLALAGFLLMAAGLVTFWSARVTAAGRFAGGLALAAAAFLAGTVLTVSMQGVTLAASASIGGAGNGASPGLGFWFMVIGFVGAVVAAALVLAPRSGRPRPPSEPEVVIHHALPE
ncbi:hypothetical protein [Amycolatopsis sp. NPDC059657]|uniref:hypothetical protein n=1 Tax=Amycolatopsis sp. NPDC059657 TaxID=3346899 RepID=UPI003672DB21